MQFAGRNNIFQPFNILFRHKWKKSPKKRKIQEKPIYQHFRCYSQTLDTLKRWLTPREKLHFRKICACFHHLFLCILREKLLKCPKRLFQTANGMPSTCLLVKMHIICPFLICNSITLVADNNCASQLMSICYIDLGFIGNYLNRPIKRVCG